MILDYNQERVKNFENMLRSQYGGVVFTTILIDHEKSIAFEFRRPRSKLLIKKHNGIASMWATNQHLVNCGRSAPNFSQ